MSNGTDNVGTYGAPATFTVTPPLPADGSVSVSVVDTDQPTCMASTVLDGSTCDRTGCALSISDVSVACSNGTDFTASFTVNWEFAEATSDMIEVTIDGDAQIFTPADVMGSQSFTDVALTGPRLRRITGSQLRRQPGVRHRNDNRPDRLYARVYGGGR